jgi:peptide/nickel transport system substrate-binding protein
MRNEQWRAKLVRAGTAVIAVLLAGALVSTPYRAAAQPAGTPFRFFNTETVGRLDNIPVNANFLQILSNQIYEQLVRFKTYSWEVVPAVAEKWTVSADGRVYTFSIRPNMRFHDGSSLTLNDVVFSINRSRGEQSLWRANYSSVAAVRADASRNAIIVTLSRKDPYFLQKLASIGASPIVPKAAVEKFGDAFGTTPESTVGAGPYRLVEKTQTQLVLESFKSHFARGAVDRLIMRVIPDQRTQQLEFEAGNVDWIPTILDNDLAKRYRDDPRYAATYQEGLANDEFWYGFNPNIRPYSDLRVRQAIAMSITMEQPVKVYGLGRVANGLIHPELPGYKPRSRTYPKNVARARALLRAAGYQQPLDLTLTVWNIPGFIAMTEAVVSQLNATGLFRVRLRTVEFGTFISEVRKGTYPFFINIVNIGVPDSALWLYDAFHSKGVFNVKYKNATVDALLDRAVAESNLARRADLAVQAEQRILQDAVAIPIMNRISVTVFQPWVRGINKYKTMGGSGYPSIRFNEIILAEKR